MVWMVWCVVQKTSHLVRVRHALAAITGRRIARQLCLIRNCGCGGRAMIRMQPQWTTLNHYIAINQCTQRREELASRRASVRVSEREHRSQLLVGNSPAVMKRNELCSAMINSAVMSSTAMNSAVQTDGETESNPWVPSGWTRQHSVQ
jgi:hypothetical protein